MALSRAEETTITALASELDITAVPKVELHVHLNGTITEVTASELARRHGADPEQALRRRLHAPGSADDRPMSSRARPGLKW